MTPLERDAMKGSPYELDEEDIDALADFGHECMRMLGSDLRATSLTGAPDMPTVCVVVSDERQRPGVVYSYEWRLRDFEDSDYDTNELGGMLVEYLGNNIMSDLSASPGLPMWEPDARGVVHVDVRSERYWAWPQEW